MPNWKDGYRSGYKDAGGKFMFPLKSLISEEVYEKVFQGFMEDIHKELSGGPSRYCDSRTTTAEQNECGMRQDSTLKCPQCKKYHEYTTGNKQSHNQKIICVFQSDDQHISQKEK